MGVEDFRAWLEGEVDGGRRPRASVVLQHFEALVEDPEPDAEQRGMRALLDQEPFRIVGTAEVAQMLGIERPRVGRLLRLERFPKPIPGLKFTGDEGLEAPVPGEPIGGPRWFVWQIEEFRPLLEETRRPRLSPEERAERERLQTERDQQREQARLGREKMLREREERRQAREGRRQAKEAAKAERARERGAAGAAA